MMWGQAELFAVATKGEIQRTKFLLGKYTGMITLMEDYQMHQADLAQVAIDGEVARRIDNEEYYANKTANAVILAEKQKWVYEEYKFYVTMLHRAYATIKDKESKKIIDLLFFQGLTRSDVLWDFSGSGLSDSTIDRRRDEGIITMANSLKIMGFFERKTGF